MQSRGEAEQQAWNNHSGKEIALGHDLYIQARIKEKKTGRVISRGDDDDYVEEDAIGFFDICWWCGSPECDVRIKMIDICNSHGGTDYADSDSFIPIPLSALRAIYEHIVNCCCFPGDESIRDLPYDRNVYEKTNLLNADKLHDLITTLDEIKCEKKVMDGCFLFKEHIPDEGDLRFFEDNPLAYEWELRIWNSY